MANNKFGASTNGRTVTIKSNKYTYNATKGVWEKAGATGSSIEALSDIAVTGNLTVGGNSVLTSADLTNLNDADTLNSLTPDQFVRSDANDIITGVLTINNHVNWNPNGYSFNIDSDSQRGTLQWLRSGSTRVNLIHETNQDHLNFEFSNTGTGQLQINGNAIATENYVDSALSTVSVTSDNGTFEVPSLTQTQINSISVHSDGSLVFNSTTNKLQLYNSGWITVGNKIPIFNTTAGNIATVYDSQRSSWGGVTISVTDSDSSSLTYSISSGSLPPGTSINSSTGAITGTPSAVGSDTTYSFTVQVTDEDGGLATREFNIIVKSPIVVTYNYTRTVQTFNIPAGLTKVHAVMWGAGGGGGNPGGQGGAGGGYTYGDIDVSSVSSLHVIVGQAGEGENNYFNDGNGNGCGGGLSGIFTQFSSDRIATYGNSVLIAGGGGGGGNNGGYPGTGGGTSGVTGSGGQGGSGGTQSAGGSTASSGGSCTSNCTAQQLRGANGCGGAEFDGGGSWPSTYWGGTWSMGAGGNGCNAGGGGGGYWGGGGGGGSPNGGQGGGGSGYIGGHANATVSNASTSANGNNRAPAGISNTYYPGTNIGYGANGAEVDGNHGAVIIVY